MLETYPGTEEKIRNDSALVDAQFTDAPAGAFRSYALSLPVPPHHPRAKSIEATAFVVGALGEQHFPGNSYYLVDRGLKDAGYAWGDNTHFVEAREDTLKEISWLDKLTQESVPAAMPAIVGVGGGVLLNAASYIAEKRGADFISVPTTVLAAADSAVGGLVRINKVVGDTFQKSFYKSVYEPNTIVLDPGFLATLPKEQISLGLSEVVKHGVYQSPALLEYLASPDFEPFSDEDALLKAICWTVALKNVAILHDPDSESFGGEILRGGHALAVTIEEASHFRVSHGEAVAVGVYQDVRQDPGQTAILNSIYQKLGLPRTQSDL